MLACGSLAARGADGAAADGQPRTGGTGCWQRCARRPSSGLRPTPPRAPFSLELEFEGDETHLRSSDASAGDRRYQRYQRSRPICPVFLLPRAYAVQGVG